MSTRLFVIVLADVLDESYVRLMIRTRVLKLDVRNGNTKGDW